MSAGVGQADPLTVKVEALTRFNLVYLATPYTRYPHGHAWADAHAKVIAARLVAQGVRVFSPVAHAHGIAVAGGLDLTDHGFWMHQCRPFLQAAGALAIAEMEGWRDSRGISEETDYFISANRPIVHLPVGELLQGLGP